MFLVQHTKNTLLHSNVVTTSIFRNASKKTGTSTRNPKWHARPKHRGWRVQDGETVVAGTILATQRTLRFHPGLNVGFGSNATLFAIIPGKVMVTCEQPNLNWDHTWVQRNYAGRMYQNFYKKYFNVIPEAQHKNFKLVDQI